MTNPQLISGGQGKEKTPAALEKERFYQEKMIRRAQKENVIVCLPTGSGKTYIAVALIRFLLPTAIQNQKKIVVLANKVHLVNQQGKYIQERIGEKDTVAIITGELNTDYWKKPEWDKVLNSCHVLVMTSEIFKQILNCAYIQFRDVALMVFDECHHAAKGDPMAKIIDDYSIKYRDTRYPKADLPKILGLTATVINGASKVENIKMDVENVEAKFCSKIITHAQYADLERHSTSAVIKPSTYISTCPTDPYWHALQSFVSTKDKLASDAFKSLNYKSVKPGIISHASYGSPVQIYFSGKTLIKTLKAVVVDVEEAFSDLGPYCARLVAKTNLAFVQILALACTPREPTQEDKEKMEAISVIKEGLEKYIAEMDIRFEKMSKKVQLETLISSKLKELIRILHEWITMKTNPTNNTSSCGIVFVKKRVTALALYWYFGEAKEHIGEKFQLLSSDFVIGCSTTRWGLNYENMHFTSKRQSEALNNFRDNTTNLIFSTSVLEEGLDVRNCNLGVRFDRIETYPSFVQSMGRVRHPKAPFYVMMDATDPTKLQKERNLLANFLKYHTRLVEHMIQKSIDQEDDDVTDFTDKEFQYEHGIPPFCPEGLPDSPKVTLDTAIQLIYRYCSTLPCDQLAPLCPYSWWSKFGSNDTIHYRAYLQFPSNSVIKEVIEGPKMKTKKLAKQVVHFEACKELYANEALDKHLLPITTEIPKAAVSFIETLRAEIQIDAEFANGKVGTKKRTQWYSKKVPDLLAGTILPNKKCFLYKICFSVEEPGPLYAFGEKEFGFGLITQQSLDMISPFPFFGNFGREGKSVVMIASLEELCCNCELTAPQLVILKYFQRHIFQKYVFLENQLLTEDSESPFLITPLKNTGIGSFQIFWDFVIPLEQSDMKAFRRRPSDFQNQSNKRFKSDIYKDAIVLKCCQDQYDSFKLTDLNCVMGISPNLTSKSLMDPPSQTKTYLEHFAKYQETLNIKILNPDFPLLEIRNPASQLNFLSTKIKDEPKSLKKNRKRKEYERYPPDLTVIYPVPASLVIQARLLPSFLQRMTRLLLSHEIQMSVADRFGWASCIETQKSADVQFPKEWMLNQTLETEIDIEEASAVNMDISTITISKDSEVFGLHLNTDDEYKATARLDCIHPDKYTDELIKNFGKHIIQQDPSPRNPMNFVNEFELCDIESLKFPSLDAKTDFRTETGPSTFAIMEALTLANANDSISMERLEFIGDSVLKLFYSAHIYFYFPHVNEGQMTNLRNHLVSNAHFYLRGKGKHIGEYIAGSIYVPDKTWLAPGTKLHPNIGEIAAKNEVNLDYFNTLPFNTLLSMVSKPTVLDSAIKSEIESNPDFFKKSKNPANTTYSHTRVGDKNIADCVEALVGAYFVNGGLCSALRFIDWLELAAPTGNEGEVVKLGVLPMAGPNYPGDAKVVQQYIPYYKKLEERISYTFKNPLLILEAFSYPDYVRNNVTGCYQRLEFLGDSVLDFLIANHIYKEVKVRTPGQLTLLKSALVNNFTLASLTVKFGFQKHLLAFFSKSFQDAIDAFVEYQANNEFVITGVLPLKPRSAWKSTDIAETLSVPKVLGDIFESLIGAVYIDSGKSLDTTWKVIYRLMESEINAFSKNIPRNVIMDLYEKFPNPPPTFLVEENESENKTSKTANDPTVVKLTIDKVGEFFASGVNKKEAKQAVAQWALDNLKI